VTALDRTPTGSDLGALVDRLRHQPDGAEQLVALLPENLPIHEGRSAAETARLRGYLLAAFADTGLPDAALPYVIESLETGHVAYEVAGAAIGLRGLRTPSVDVGPALLRAIDNLTGADATVTFESPRPTWPYARPTTALTEVVRTIGQLQAAAGSALPRLELLARESNRFAGPVLAEMRQVLDRTRSEHGSCTCAGPGDCGCCSAAPAAEATVEDTCCAGTAPAVETAAGAGTDVVLEDQEGRRETFAGFFRGKPSVIAFFYTRCDNPYKCSLTITKLAALQDSLDGRGLAGAVRVAAITYDPDFDLPHRLRSYGEERRVRFGEDARFFRATSGFAAIRERFQLGVNYGASTVNRHRSEVFVLDEHGDVATAFTRVQWEVDAVLRSVVSLLHRGPVQPGP
jgi:protein SCO1/2